MALDNSIYTDEELVLMEKTKRIRLDVIDNMVKGGVPDKVGEIRVLNEMLTAAEKNVQDSANNRLKHQDSANTEATLEIVAQTLKTISTSRSNLPTIDPKLDKEYMDVELVPGEVEVNPSKLELEDIMNSGT